VKIGEGQQKIKIIRTNRQSNLRGSCQSIFSLSRHHPKEAPQKRIKVKVEEGTMPTKPEPSSAGDVELSGEVHTILINGFPSASGSCAMSARWYARSAMSCQQGLCPFKNNVNSIGILTQKLNSK